MDKLHRVLFYFSIFITHLNNWITTNYLFRICRIAVCHTVAFLIGEEYEDALLTISKHRLMANDSYRDRLLAPEIGELVDVWEALQMSVSQRNAFFRCFLHLDYMRRAGVSRAELLRYCNLHHTPAAEYLLPSDGKYAVEASSHRHHEYRTQRWDVVQLLAVCFSLCTMDNHVVCLE